MLAIVPRVVAWIVRVLAMTWRCEYRSEPGALPLLQYPVPGIYPFWHRSLLASAGHFRDRGIAILISRSFDGELIARTVERLGFIAVRGSSSRGGSSGLRAMQQAYMDGRRVAITADGPRGPKFIAKPGTAQLAQLTGGQVMPFYVLPQRSWTLNSWDSFMIPKPFSRVVITNAKCVEYMPDVEAMQAAVQAGLDRCVLMAEKHWGEHA